MVTEGRPMRAWISIASAVLAALALAGCSSPVPDGGRPVREVYEDMDGPLGPGLVVVAPTPEPGAPARTRPVIFPPKILAVFVQEHVDPTRDFKIGSHWVYIKLRDSAWMEQPIDREPQSSLPLEKNEDLRPVKRVFSEKGFSEALIPYKGQAAAPAAPPREEPPAKPQRDYQEFVRQGQVQR
jgi:hypothetical protein